MNNNDKKLIIEEKTILNIKNIIDNYLSHTKNCAVSKGSNNCTCGLDSSLRDYNKNIRSVQRIP